MTDSPDDSAPAAYRYDVFISYHPDDAAFVFEALLPALEAAGLSVAIDVKTFDPGGTRQDEAEQAVLESRHTLAVLTPAWAADGWDGFEAAVTQSEDPAAHGRKLIPLLLEKPGALPRRIERLHWVDVRTPEDRPTQIQRVIRAVQGRGELPELKPYAAYPTGWQRLWELRLIGGVAVGVVLLLGLVGWLVWSQRPEPPPTAMPAGTYNIAVAAFTPVDGTGEEAADPAVAVEGEARALGVANFLDSQKGELEQFVSSAVEIWGPENGVASVKMGTEQARIAELNANLLIYGTIGQDGEGGWMLTPRFVLRDPELAEASATYARELSGVYALGREIAYPANDVGVGQANSAVESRLEALVLLVEGFFFFSQESADGYVKAIDAFEQATRTEWGQSDDSSGQAILHFFLGYGYLQQLNFLAQTNAPLDERQALIAQGLAALNTAHEADPFYVKVYNGLGIGYFRQAQLAQLEGGGCGWDWEALDEAALWFQDTLAAPDDQKQLSGDVDLAAHSWLGTIEFTRAICGQADSWQAAQEHYRFVVESYEADPRPDQQISAILAYRELAHTDFLNPARDLSPGSPDLQRALDNYARSVALGVERGTERSLLLARDSLTFQLNALCQAGQIEELRPALDSFVENFDNPPPVRATIVDNARLRARSEECHNAIATE